MELSGGYGRNQIANWHPDVPYDALSALAGLADQIEDHFGALNLRLANLPDTGGWTGDAHAAAVEKLAQIRGHAIDRADALRVLRKNGITAIADLDTARQRLLATARYAEAEGLVVTDDWVVTPGSGDVDQAVIDEWVQEISSGLGTLATADTDAATAIDQAIELLTLTNGNVRGFLPVAIAGLGVAVEITAWALVAAGVVTGAAVIAYLIDKFDGIASIEDILSHIPSQFLSDNGPGEWAEVNRDGVSDRSKAYEEQVTGASSGTEYEVEGVKFDGWEAGGDDEPGTLVEAKGPGYDQFLDKDGNFQPWWKGDESLVDQAQRQIRAVEASGGDATIEWRVAEEKSAEAIERLLDERGIDGIDVVWVPAE
ncbi:Tox-REase-5 domain-containing protein [Rhodococcus spongiicola]|uniref:Tox-REase-5 domain-containing protein n=1 Tax=Rhodococcus spongiicola TaxID=2487352 RepID=A0A3S3AEL5_9NOCA|nr:Tox-REase-5 domain-containing protein [Rhodococcus spongiicola]RVW06279.1 hypothetical protein EF834_02170 [Rhodococcus spongiicola]